MSEHLLKYVGYIKNTGLVPLPTAAFDDDWAPIGPELRKQMQAAGLITERADGLRIKRPETQVDIILAGT